MAALPAGTRLIAADLNADGLISAPPTVERRAGFEGFESAPLSSIACCRSHNGHDARAVLRA